MRTDKYSRASIRYNASSKSLIIVIYKPVFKSFYMMHDTILLNCAVASGKQK